MYRKYLIISKIKASSEITLSLSQFFFLVGFKANLYLIHFLNEDFEELRQAAIFEWFFKVSEFLNWFFMRD